MDAHTFNAERRNAQRTNRIPHAHHLDPDRLRILEHPLLLQRNVGKGAGQLKLSKLPSVRSSDRFIARKAEQLRAENLASEDRASQSSQIGFLQCTHRG